MVCFRCRFRLLVLEATYCRSCLNAITFLKKALKLCSNKPPVIVDGVPWYRWALERPGIEYRFERFFRYLKERTMVFHHRMSARDHIEGTRNLNPTLKTLHTIPPNHQDGGGMKCLSGHYLH